MLLSKLTRSLAGAALLASAVPAAAQTDLNAARESLRGFDTGVSSHVARAGLVDGLAPHLADSAHVLIPGATIITGKAAALAALGSGSTAGARLRWEAVRLDVSADGRSGYTYGGGTRTNADGSTTPARYIAFWDWDGDEWKISAFLFNANPRPITPPPAGFFPEPPRTGSAASGASGSEALGQIMQADRDFAAMAQAQNVAAAFGVWAAPDGALLGGEYGPDAIRAAFAGGGGTLEWAPVAGGMAGSGDLGYTVGTGVRRGQDGQVGYTKYLSVWRRQPNGEWRWVVDGGNPRPADQ